nr:hypothetical protein Iba_chr10dCG9360 [Ipomoea batatas]
MATVVSAMMLQTLNGNFPDLIITALESYRPVVGSTWGFGILFRFLRERRDPISDRIPRENMVVENGWGSWVCKDVSNILAFPFHLEISNDPSGGNQMIILKSQHELGYGHHPTTPGGLPLVSDNLQYSHLSIAYTLKPWHKISCPEPVPEHILIGGRFKSKVFSKTTSEVSINGGDSSDSKSFPSRAMLGSCRSSEKAVGDLSKISVFAGKNCGLEVQ